jgi:prophage regulatory protein
VQPQTTRYLLRFPAVLSATGLKASAQYEAIAMGVFPRGVRIGPRAVGWPDNEVSAIVAARVAGWDEEQLKELVKHLHEKRKSAAAGLMGGI